jgi:hypothetical protein
MNVTARALLALLPALAIAACSSNGASGTDAAADTNTPPPPPAPDGASDTGGLPSCPQTIADYCAQHPGSPPGTFGIHCAMTLAAAESDPYFCSLVAHVTESACGSYTDILQMGVDTGYHYYYDANGALLAIVAYSANFGGSTNCVAGPAMLALPHSACASPVPLPDCGVDGGNGG